MTLAVIYKLVLHRVVVNVDIITLSGLVLLGIDGWYKFIDICNNCRFLSVDDCMTIVGSNGKEWSDELIHPLTTINVVSGMAGIASRCQETSMHQMRTTCHYID